MIKPASLRRRHFAALTGAAVLTVPMVARGQGKWKPEKPITIYNPFAAGGGTDIHIRLMGETAGPRLGQPIVVDSRPGAPGTLACLSGQTASKCVKFRVLSTNPFILERELSRRQWRRKRVGFGLCSVGNAELDRAVSAR